MAQNRAKLLSLFLFQQPRLITTVRKQKRSQSSGEGLVLSTASCSAFANGTLSIFLGCLAPLSRLHARMCSDTVLRNAGINSVLTWIFSTYALALAAIVAPANVPESN